MSRRARLGRTFGVLGALGVGGLVWGLTEARMFTVRHVAVPVLAPGSAPVRVLHISDLHLLARQTHKRRWVRALADLEPDLVVNTGDNFCSPDSLEPLLEALGPLLEVPGLFVFGSNDYLEPQFRNPLGYLLHGRSSEPEGPLPELPHEQLRQAFTEAGWTDLNDASAQLEVAGLRIDARGTDDAHHDRDHYQWVAGPVDQGCDLAVGVTHAPYRRILDAMTDDGVDLILAGHTHGGQVCLPFKGAIITNCDLDTERVKGLSSHTSGTRTSWLHVSAGLGTSPFAPYRFFCRPEATLVTLVGREG